MIDDDGMLELFNSQDKKYLVKAILKYRKTRDIKDAELILKYEKLYDDNPFSPWKVRKIKDDK